MQNSSLNRIKVIKYSKDLSSQVWAAQYRNFSDSQWIDEPMGAALSNDGSSLFAGGEIDLMSSNPTGVLLKITTASGTITATNLGQIAGTAEMAFDSSGTLYGISGGSVVKVNVTTMVVTSLNIAATHLTLDAVNGIMYISNGTNAAGMYDLSGNII